MLQQVVGKSETKAGVDNIPLNAALCSMASAQINSRAAEAAKSTMDRMVSIFSKTGLKAHMIKLIREQAKETLKHEL
ncbi:MAG: hypothetical protein WBF05_16905 [Anaerolineales bacterium]